MRWGWIALLAGLAAGRALAADNHAAPDITPPSPANEHTIENSYPEMSRALYEEGVVTLKFIIQTDGKPTNVQVVHSSGYPRLDAAAVDEVGQKWLYHPALRDGKPFAALYEANVNYRLRDDPAYGQYAVFKMTPNQFPPGDREKNESGVTRLLVYIRSDGTVSNVETTQSSGYDDLDAAARKQVDGWTFTPATLNGKPMDSGMSVLFVWPAAVDSKAP